MSTRIDVINYSLGLLGESPLTAAQLQDGSSDKALTMGNLYRIAQKALLEAYEWSFAIKRFQPAKSSPDPVWGWSNSFPLPDDVMRLLRVDRNSSIGQFGGDMHRNQVDHELEGRNILTNVDPIYCTGIRFMEDEGSYSPLFTEAFATKLAFLAAIPIAESNQKQNNMAALYTAAINLAKSRDGMQGSTRRLRSTWLTGARGSGRR